MEILVTEMGCWRCVRKTFQDKSGMRHLEKRLEGGGERKWTRWETDMIRACSSNGRRKLAMPGIGMESSRATEKGQNKIIWNEDIIKLMTEQTWHEKPLTEGRSSRSSKKHPACKSNSGPPSFQQLAEVTDKCKTGRSYTKLRNH
jgi:hypothetical protein